MRLFYFFCKIENKIEIIHHKWGFPETQFLGADSILKQTLEFPVWGMEDI